MAREVMYFTSIQGSGTQFFGNILDQHPKVTIVSMGGQYPVFSLVSLLKDGKIDEEMFDLLVIYCGMVQGEADIWHRLTSRSDRLRMFEMYRQPPSTVRKYICDCSFEKIFIFSHLFPAVRGERFHTITDLAFENGVHRRAVVPLRDPVKQMFTLMKRASFSQFARNRETSLAVRGYGMLLEFSQKCDTFFFPVDLCEVDRGVRKDRIKALFDFIGLSVPKALQPILDVYERINTGRPHELPPEMEMLVDSFRKDLPVKGLNTEMGIHMAKLRKIEGLAEIYRSAGYKDLEWF